ncbi:MAG TPA: DUF4157 domain-containing protein [Chthoniobacter sp.]|nr:DUF4157 domain-containing protein [Chthoniobacter sp.]
MTAAKAHATSEKSAARAVAPPSTEVKRSSSSLETLARLAHEQSASRVQEHTRQPVTSAAAMLACQRLYGNAHVQRMLAGKERKEPAQPEVEKRAPQNDHHLVSLSAEEPARLSVDERRPQTVQRLMRVSSPHDPAEKEAVSVARQIMRDPAPNPPAPTAGGESKVQRKETGPPQMKAQTHTAIQSEMGGGAPLPPATRRFMEPRFHADFSAVKIHTDDRAVQLSRDLHAQAFTVGQHIFFGRNRFRPESDEGRELIAHELVHTLQQGGAKPAPREAARAEATHTTEPHVQRLGMDDVLQFIAGKANWIPGFRLLTILLGSNPITREPVEASAANLLRALIELLPGGALVAEALANAGVFEKAGAFVEGQLRKLGMAGAAIYKAVHDFLDSLGITDIVHPSEVWERAKRLVTEPVDRLLAFGKGLVTGLVQMIKDAILQPIARLAAGTPGYDLLKAVMGKDPITGEVVPRTPETIIAPFLKLIGEEEIWENMQRSKAVPRVWAWFQKALAGVESFVMAIPGLFVAAFRSLELVDIVIVPRAFAKLAGVFGGFLVRFATWAGGAVWNLLEIIFDVVSPGALAYVKKTGAALKGILKNPAPFVGNLVKSAKNGFLNFAGNILTHLKEGLINWLTGSLPGVYIPKAFELGEVVKFVFSVLGLTWQNVRGKLVRAIGEPAVKVLEVGFDVVVTLVRDGPAAAWTKIKEHLGNLKDMVLDGIIGFVVETIVKKAIPKLIAMFIPGAGFISAILSIYDTVMVFVNKLKEIVAVVTGFVNSIVDIAEGKINAAVEKVESVLSGLLTLAINFLAGFLGLGNVAEKIKGVIEKVRGFVDKALDRLIGWIVGAAKKLIGAVLGKGGAGAAPGSPAAGGAAADGGAEAKVQSSFAMGSEDHVITVKTVGKNLVITMASARDLDLETQIKSAISEVEADNGRTPKEKRKILEDFLKPALIRTGNIRLEYEREGRTMKFDAFAIPRIAKIVALLSGLSKFNPPITSLQHIISRGRPRFLPRGYKTRKQLYDRASNFGFKDISKDMRDKETSRLREICRNIWVRRDDKSKPTNYAEAEGEWNALFTSSPPQLARERATTFASYDHPNQFQLFQFETDHDPSLGAAWNSGENDTADSERAATNLGRGRSTLRVLTKQENQARAKNKSVNPNYTSEVGPNFESAVANCPKGSMLIDGEEFSPTPP